MGLYSPHKLGNLEGFMELSESLEDNSTLRLGYLYRL